MSYEPTDDAKPDADPPFAPKTAGDMAKALRQLIAGFQASIDTLAQFARELEQQARGRARPPSDLGDDIPF